MLAIQEYSFTIKYCKGSENTTADTLSRYPPVEKEEVYEAADDELRVLNMQYTVAPEAINVLQNLGREQDDNLALLAKKLMLACLLYTSAECCRIYSASLLDAHFGTFFVDW